MRAERYELALCRVLCLTSYGVSDIGRGTARSDIGFLSAKLMMLSASSCIERVKLPSLKLAERRLGAKNS
jgi:hypothetical protein